MLEQQPPEGLQFWSCGSIKLSTLGRQCAVNFVISLASINCAFACLVPIKHLVFSMATMMVVSLWALCSPLLRLVVAHELIWIVQLQWKNPRLSFNICES